MKDNCLKYEKCPFCKGCRAYSSSDLECIECSKNSRNICNTSKHKPELINKMIKKDKIVLK